MDRELEALEIVFRSALARLGLALGLLARDEWQSVNPLRPGGGEWESRVWRLAFGGREAARRLTLAYYLLARAIETGVALMPDGEETLDDLRDGFLYMVESILDLDMDVGPDVDIDEQLLYDYLGDMKERDPERLPRDELEDAIEDWLTERGPDGDLKFEEFLWPQDEVESHRDAAEVFGEYLLDAGIDGLAEKLAKLQRVHADDSQAFSSAAEREFEIHGNKVAAVIDKVAMDAGREFIDRAAEKDSMRSRMMVARGVRSNPCHFCAMLASRGFVYLSERSAMGDTGYHPNCHCFPIVRWVSDKLPERNEYYQSKWSEITRGKSGREARKTWRRWINAERRERASEQ